MCSKQGVRGAERDLGVPVAVLGVLGASQLQQERARAQRAPAAAHMARRDLPGQHSAFHSKLICLRNLIGRLCCRETDKMDWKQI